MRLSTWSCAGSLAAVVLVAGCGGGEDGGPAKRQPAVRVGPVVYRDALNDNRGGWLVDRSHGFVFTDGRYEWGSLPQLPAGPAVESEAMLERGVPEGIAVSVAVAQDRGAALRALYCRARGRSTSCRRSRTSSVSTGARRSCGASRTRRRHGCSRGPS